MTKNRILVTGGAGFIGSHLCDRLIEMGNEVICIDNCYTGNKENIRHLIGSPYFEFIRHDVIDPIYIECNQIYNLACPASPLHYQKDPIYTTKTSFMGTLNALGLAKRNGARILQASTSEIYGDPAISPQVESYWGNVNTIGPRSCYDEGKRVAETLMFDYHRKHNVDIRIMRIFNTYGPRMSVGDGRVISNFIVQALRGEDITIFGDGKQTRSFCYVDDLVDGMISLMNCDADITGPINIGNPGEYTMLELATKILEITKSNSKIVYKELPIDDPKKRKPDISMARNILGFEPKIELDIGLHMTTDYFKKVMNI